MIGCAWSFVSGGRAEVLRTLSQLEAASDKLIVKADSRGQDEACSNTPEVR